jgi:hypothetical protein
MESMSCENKVNVFNATSFTMHARTRYQHPNGMDDVRAFLRASEPIDAPRSLLSTIGFVDLRPCEADSCHHFNSGSSLSPFPIA